MITVTGIGALTESAKARLMKSRDREPLTSKEQEQDGVTISEAAQEARKVKELIEESKAISEIRRERVEAAKKSIEEGSYKVQEVVMNVAARMAPYVAPQV